MDDLIRREDAIEVIYRALRTPVPDYRKDPFHDSMSLAVSMGREIQSAQPTLYGYNIEHLELIARVLQKENLPPERVVKALTDIGEIVAIVRDEFEETLRKAVEQCTI